MYTASVVAMGHGFKEEDKCVCVCVCVYLGYTQKVSFCDPPILHLRYVRTVTYVVRKITLLSSTVPPILHLCTYCTVAVRSLYYCTTYYELS